MESCGYAYDEETDKGSLAQGERRRHRRRRGDQRGLFLGNISSKSIMSPLFSSEVYADEMLFRGYQDFKIDIYLQVLFCKQNAYSLGIEIR